MKKAALVYFLFITMLPVLGQQGFYGIQNSQRKGMVNALMNPAELNNLSKKVEVTFFSADASLSNNVLSYQDILDDPDQWETIFQNISEPVNLRTDFSIMGPSVGLRIDKWSFGFTSQLKGKADIIDFNPDLGDAIVTESISGNNSQTVLNIPYNQRLNTIGWMELGLMVGTSLIDNDLHALSIGGHFKALFPGTYANLGLDEIQATLVSESDQISLTNATGALNLSYDERWDSNNGNAFDQNLWQGLSPNGFAMDLGVNYQLRTFGRTFLNTGLSIKNLGSMTAPQDQITRNYSMNIPQNEFFRIDNLEGDVADIEQQLIDSGYFTIDRESSLTKINLPQLLAAYVEFSPVKQFQVSLYAQKRMANENGNQQLSGPDLLVLTPRLILGKLEIYSPWMQHQVAGLTGGFGLQYGGFFVGSHSLVTGLIADSNRADVHAGLSWGFGRND
ncbi:DUF5723 family protein [Cyclobacterium plantarum]|uniref:DUF5723 family protein n=1 Tax=Cyclobacterium plantarum TaxID=2716263 RepID=UPI003F6E6568